MLQILHLLLWSTLRRYSCTANAACTTVLGGAVAPLDRDLRNRDTARLLPCSLGVTATNRYSSAAFAAKGTPIVGPRVSDHGPIVWYGKFIQG